MAVDLYAPCPCGSGKKLKFCCGDLAGEIEKINQLAEGDQPRAALQHVERLLAKDPTRGSLLDIRAMLELGLDELNAAEETIRQYLAAHPQSASAHAQAAMLEATREQPAAAVEKLQDALEVIDRDMSERVFDAIGAVGHALLLAGDIIAARAHFQFMAAVSPTNDHRAIDLLLRLNLQAGLPLLLRDQLHLAPPPDNAPYRRVCDEAARLAEIGRWRRAESELKKVLDREHPQPAVVYSLGVLEGWQGKKQAFVERLRQFSRLDVPLDDAVEAEALAQLVEPAGDEAKLQSIRVTYPLHDEDRAIELLAADRRAERFELDPETMAADDVTRPRCTYLLLDRPAPRTGAGLAVGDVPNALAFLSIYGKRTDRGARLEATTDRGRQFAAVESAMQEILGDAIGPAEHTDVVAEKRAADEALSWRWRLPDDTPPAERRQLMNQRRRQAILDDWTAAPQAALRGFSPQEAAPWPDSRIPLLAAVLIVEQAANDRSELDLFQELRDKLGLPRTTPLDPASVELERLPLVRFTRLELTTVADDGLMRLFNRAAMTGARLATLAAGKEIVARPALTEGVDTVYRHLVRHEPDPDQALAWVRQARQRTEELGVSPVEWVLLELEVQIERGDPVAVQSVINELRAKHIHEPGVAEAVYKLLYAAGLIDPRELAPAAAGGGRPAGPPENLVPPPAGKIWTPDQQSNAPAGGKSAIWTP